MRTTRLLVLAFLFLAAVGCPGHKKLTLPGIFEALQNPGEPFDMAVRSDEFGYIEIDKPEDAVWLLRCGFAAMPDTEYDHQVRRAFKLALDALGESTEGEAPC